MTREQEIKSASLRRYGSECRAADHFAEGARWADRHPHWVSVEDELPPEGTPCLVYDERDGVQCASYRAGKYFKGQSEWGWHMQVTHWMRLPVRQPKKTSKMSKTELWHRADGDYLPDYMREVIALRGDMVCFAHRPAPEDSIYVDGKDYQPETYGKGGWNLPDIDWWLDIDAPVSDAEDNQDD